MTARQDGRPTEPAVPSFADLFSLADFQRFTALERRTDLPQGEQVEAYRALLDETMAPALARFMGALLDAGRLTRLSGTGGRRGNIMDAWNGLFSNDGERQARLEFLGHRFSHAFLFRKVDEAVHREGKYADDKAAYDAMVAAVDRGDLRRHEALVEDYCFSSGERFHLAFAGWTPRFDRFEGGAFLTMEDVSVPAVAECEVEFETGEVLVADWFRIEAFTDAVKEAEDDGNDINSALGCIRRTQEYAERLNFVSVMVGNSCPSVLCDDGLVTVGRVDEDMEGGNPPEPAGWICTDLWWATLIDRKRLVGIVAERTGAAAAEAAVSDYLDRHDVLTLRLAPGRYRLYFSGDSQDFADRFHSPDLAFDPSVRPMFVLSPRALELVDEPVVAPAGP